MTTQSEAGVTLAAYVLTLNEEANIPGAIASIRQVTDNIVIVDSGSIDQTVERAQAAGVAVQVRPFDTFGQQRNFAMDRVVELFDPEWIVTIDADERLSSGLVEELRNLGRAASPVIVDAYMVPLAVRFEGRILRHGGLGRSRLLRVYRPNAGRYESRSVNEHFVLRPRAILGRLRHPIEHEDVASWERHIAKHNRYSTLEAAERVRQSDTDSHAVAVRDAVRARYLRRRWIRERVWNRMPAKPLLRFVQMYVVCGGFLDGRPGMDIAIFQAWQELCTESKFRELKRASAAPPNTT